MPAVACFPNVNRTPMTDGARRRSGFRAANLTGESREKLKANGDLETEEGSRYYSLGLTARF